jgi:hypothetical protein
MKKFSAFASWRARCRAALLIFVLAGVSPVDGDVVFAWNELLLHLTTRSADPVAPHLESRRFAIAHVAMDEAAAAAVGIGKTRDATLFAQRAAIVSAAQAVLAQLLPADTVTIDAVAGRHLAAVPEGVEKVRGIETGRAKAKQVLARRGQDRWVEMMLFNPPFGPRPDASEATALALTRGETVPPSPWLQPTPFALKAADQFPVREVRTINRGGEVYVDYALQSSRLFAGVDQAAAFQSAADTWSQRPVVVWNRIARQICAMRPVNLAEQARLLAMLNAALADATISTLHWRHTLGSWRCIVADMVEPLNGMPPASTDVILRGSTAHGTELVRLETQRILIPPTPNYPSFTATSAGAAEAVLARFLKNDQLEFALPAGVGQTMPPREARAPRTFTSVSAAARECAFVSSLDGRHTREACIAGYSLGVAIGGYVSKKFSPRR